MDFESCQSYEKLVIDAEIIGMAKRLWEGMTQRNKTFALDLIRKHGHNADYLMDPDTLKWFDKEQYVPSSVIDRKTHGGWLDEGERSIFTRAQERVVEMLDKYEPIYMDLDKKAELRRITEKAAQKFGMQKLPEIK